MSILIFTLSIGLTILFAILCDKSYKNEDLFDMLAGIFAIIAAIFFIVTICLMVRCSKLNKINDIISMYQEENESIENNMDELVKGYMDYEKTTLTEFTPESSVTLVSLYPELKSDDLVKQQIDIYMANNQKIKELKEKEIYASVYKWWLYFGGK